MHIEEIIAKIVPIDKGCVKLAQTRFDNLIKPVGSLAKLEEMTSRYCGILGVYEKQDLDYPKRDLLVWCSIAEAEQAGKIIDAKWPVNVLAAETGGRCVALVVTSETEEDAREEGAEEALDELHLSAPLRLHIPDGAGEGAALCFTLFNAGIKAFKEMETFEEAGVHAEKKEFSLAEQNKKEQGK